MYYPLLKSHSGLRWVFLIVLLLSLVYLYQAAFSNKNSDKALRFSKITVILSHIQLLLGFVLYFISPKVVFAAESMKHTLTRFYLLEHISIMVFGIAIMTGFYLKAKKSPTNSTVFKKLFYAFIIGFIFMLIAIPWPFRELGAGWF